MTAALSPLPVPAYRTAPIRSAGLDPYERAHLDALLHEVASTLDTGHSEIGD